MMAEMMTDERRSCERVAWPCHARLLPLSLEARGRLPGMQEVTGKDISEGGLRVESQRLFALHSPLLVEMNSPEMPEGIQAVGSVAWISPSHGQNGRWQLGIEFSDVGDSALAGIRCLLQASHPCGQDAQRLR